MLYNIVYADPPWEYRDKKLNRGGARKYYDTMSIKDLCNLPVKNITAKNSFLFMWVTAPMLNVCFDIINAWGFMYKTVAFTWVKTTKNKKLFWGMGGWTRSNSEFCLLGIKGKPKRINAGVHQIIIDPVRKHSQKPDRTRKRIIKLCGDLPRIELFARNYYAGWDVWGDQVYSTTNPGV